MLTLPIWAFVLCVLAGPVTYAALDAWRTRRQPKRGPHQIRCEFAVSGYGEALDAVASAQRASAAVARFAKANKASPLDAA